MENPPCYTWFSHQNAFKPGFPWSHVSRGAKGMSMASGNFFAADQQFSTCERTLGRSLWAKKKCNTKFFGRFPWLPSGVIQHGLEIKKKRTE